MTLILQVLFVALLIFVLYKWANTMGWLETKPPKEVVKVNVDYNDGQSKDPTDMSVCDRAKKWDVGDCCPSCLKWSSFDEYCDSQCHTCGYMGSMKHDGKMHRKIFFQGDWRDQIVYRWNKVTTIDGEEYGKVIPPESR